MLYDYQTWSEEPLMEAKDDGDLHGGQRSTEVKYSKLSSMATKLGKGNFNEGVDLGSEVP